MTIQPLPPMPQLKLNTEGKPAIPSWVAPPETKLDDIQWQPLRTLDLALLDGTPEQQKECQETFAAAVKNEGFVLIKNFGVAPAVMQRMYDLANWTLNGDALSEEDKKKYEWDFDNGNWAGYKPPIGWSERGKAQPDFMEFYNWYGECWDKDMIPPKLRPFEDEIRAYASHMYNDVSRRVLVILSRILGLEDNYLWDNVAAKGHFLPGSCYCRFQAVHSVPENHGVCTLIPSQPITCLQMCGADGVWRYVPYVKDTVVANLGDVMEVASGGIFKATRHRVIKPVADQQDYERVSVISFNHADPDFPMEPIWHAPLIKEQGVQKDSQVYGAFLKAIEGGMQTPKFGDWKKFRNLGTQALQSAQKTVMINGKPHTENDVGGVKVYREI
ncbi:hypothetical protein EHS25_000603 [Saitozyma podzolica]|uniref:Fe2OG dioxygenase domain-containing protein n=1 Tax=Saitozyma podzolica TaxID=1890683 RepID=A0A427YX03_9TREE|nr:hypothetical protein EHS25_000603 [Saitozyma podzolica]